MQKTELENEIDFLLREAIKKCGNVYDAEDIVQETMLSALAFLKRENAINDMRAWLLTVLNRKYYDMLRRQYRMPITHIPDGFDAADERDGDYDNDYDEVHQHPAPMVFAIEK